MGLRGSRVSLEISVSDETQNVQIFDIMIITHFLKLFRQIIIILSASYYCGLMWFILSDLNLNGLRFSDEFQARE